MSDIKLFRIAENSATQLESRASHLEKPLQLLIESNLEILLAIRFLASEHGTGSKHGGRIDTLGIDENGCPVVIEYKRSVNENVITQGLYYLDWLMDHKAEFELLIQKKLGAPAAEEIDWGAPRLICVASDFTKYDAYAVDQIDRSIDLIRYRQFGPNLLLLEQVNSTERENEPKAKKEFQSIAQAQPATPKLRPKWMRDVNPKVKELFEALESYIFSLGDDVERKNLKLYIAFKRLKNFATVVGHPEHLHVFLHLDPSTIEFVEGFTRNVSGVGHWGTGDVRVCIASLTDLEKAKPLIARAYNPANLDFA